MTDLSRMDRRRKFAFLALGFFVSLGAVVAVAPAAGATGYKVVAVGDIACSPGATVTANACHQRRVADLVKRLAPRQLWLVGDLQYDRGERSAFDAVFDRSWGRYRAISHPVPGNHEYYTPGAAGYFGYFGWRAGTAGRGYYSFRAGAWHVVALNSNCDQVACGAGSRQLRWLRADLRANHRRCVAAIWHHPLYSSGAHGANPAVRPLWRELRKARAELVISGHDHDFETFLPRDENGVAHARSGLRQFVSGAGGRSLYPVGGPASNSQSVIAGHFGALALMLRRGGYAWRFVDERGRTRAADSAVCR